MNIKQLDITCLIIIVIVSITCVYLSVSHSIKRQKQLKIEKEILHKQLKEVNLAELNLQELKTVLDDTRSEINALNERIPKSGKIGVFLKQIDSLMKQRKIVLISLQPQLAVKGKIYTKNPIKVLFKGSFASIYHFLHDLETMNRILVMEEMMISKADEAKECMVDLTAVIFER